MKKLALFMFLFLTVTTCACLTVGAETDDAFVIVIPYVETPPVLDGIAMNGEYPEEPTVMDDRTAEAWVGEMSRETSTVWNFAWDETGLYIFANIKDNTPVYRDEITHWVGADCVELGLNPGHLLDKPDDKGVFFSMGATADGQVVIYRHNYDEKIISSEVRGCAVGHTEGNHSYTIEVCIPWQQIFIEADCTKTDTHLDATHLTPGDLLIMDMVPAAIDAADDSTVGVAYKFNGTDFVTGQYIQGVLTRQTPAETAETVGTTPSDTEPAAYPESQTSTVSALETESHSTNVGSSNETAPQTAGQGCQSMISGAVTLWFMIPLSALVLRRQKQVQ